MTHQDMAKDKAGDVATDAAKDGVKRARRSRPQIVTLTEAAAERLRAIAAQRGDGALLRVGVRNGGCAGMEYTMAWSEIANRFDEVVEDKDVRILVDAKAVLFLIGTVMDYRIEKLSSQFVFLNPNQTSACGCGESVAIQPRPEAEMTAAELNEQSA